MYVCMHVCMHVCMYVCMYISIRICRLAELPMPTFSGPRTLQAGPCPGPEPRWSRYLPTTGASRTYVTQPPRAKNMSFTYHSNSAIPILPLHFCKITNELHSKIDVDSAHWYTIANCINDQNGSCLRMRMSFKVPVELVQFARKLTLKEKKNIEIDKFVHLDVIEWKVQDADTYIYIHTHTHRDAVPMLEKEPWEKEPWGLGFRV